MKLWHAVLLILSLMVQSVAVQATDELVVYSGRSDKFVRPVIQAFEKKTGIKVIVHNAKSALLINKLKIEQSKTSADLFLSNDAGSLQVASNMQLLAKLPKETVVKIPANYRAQDNTWVGLSARARVLVVNKNKMNQLGFVKSVLDLADPRLKGRLGITHSANGSFIAGVTVYQKTIGDDKTLAWLEGLKRNSEGKVYNKHSKVVRDVALGKKDIGLVNHYYIYRHLDKNPDAPISILIPDQGEKGMGVAWNVAGIGVIKHSQKKALAMKFIDYLVSEEGQTIFAEVNREYPTRVGVAAAKQIPVSGSYKVADVEMSALGNGRVATIGLIDKAGMP